MSFAVKQLRYYGKNNTNNEPDDISPRGNNNLINGKNVVKLGIQAPPGTHFWVNSDPDYNADTSVIVGLTGIYEIDLTNLSYITSLKFDDNSINLIDNNNSLSLIIDYIYEEIEGVDLT